MYRTDIGAPFDIYHCKNKVGEKAYNSSHYHSFYLNCTIKLYW